MSKLIDVKIAIWQSDYHNYEHFQPFKFVQKLNNFL